MNPSTTKAGQPHLHPFTHVSENQEATYLAGSAKGVRIYDSSGREYIDALSGLWCVNIGYGEQRLTDAMHEASKQCSFAPTLFGASNKYVDELADKLIQLSPRNCMRKVFFGHSGSDANDTNMKLVRLYFLTAGQPQRTKFISRHGSYHGTTFATANLSGLPSHHRNFDFPDGPYLHVSAPDAFNSLRSFKFDSEEQYADSLVAELEAVILEQGPDTVAAFVAEPVMAVGGILLPPKTYFSKVKKVLDKHGILLMMDDVVCSFGRLGHWFGWETTGVEPDLVAIAKGFTSGYIAMSASIIGDRVWSLIDKHQDEIGVLGHGFTLSGHPVAAAVALANINVIEEDGLLNAATEQGAYLRDALHRELNGLSCIGDIRGAGLLVGIEVLPNYRPESSRVPGAVAVSIVNRCRELGLIVRACPGRNVIALAPPLVIRKPELDQVVRTLGQAIRDEVELF